MGLDEHTGLIMDFESGMAEVGGVSSVSIVRECDPKIYPSGTKFELKEIGDFKIPDPMNKDIPENVWNMVVNAPPLEGDKPSDDVVLLAEKRLTVRAEKNWAESDKLRDEIAALGWTVQDKKDGYELVKS